MDKNKCRIHKETRKAFLKQAEEKTLTNACYLKYFIQKALWYVTTATTKYLTQTYLEVIQVNREERSYEALTWQPY